MEKYFIYTLLCEHFQKRDDSLSREVLDWIIEYELRKSKKIQQVCNRFIKRFKSSGAKKAVIYGAGEYGRLLFDMFLLNDIETLGFVDTYKKGEYLGRTILSPEEYVEKFNDIKCAVAIIGGSNENRRKIALLLNDLNAIKENIYYMADEWLSFPLNAVSENLCKKSGEPRWFSLPELFASPKDVFVDIGSNDGKALDDFICWKSGSGGEYKVFSFEVVSQKYELQKRKYKSNPNIIVYNLGCGKENGQMNFTEYACATAKLSNKVTPSQIDVCTIDSLLSEENITYLKINTVGTECDVIEGAKDTIKRCNPIIGVAIFMNADLWWKVPKLIWSINSDYQLYMRQYRVDAAVIYAIPKL